MSEPPARRLPRLLLAALRDEGLDVDALARAAGLASLEGFLAPDAADRFFALALASVGDPAFGLRLGASLRPELFDVIGFAAMSRRTYGEALALLARYKRMVTGDRLELARTPTEARLRFRAAPLAPPALAIKIEAELAFLVTFGRRLGAAPALAPRRVSFEHEAPPHAAACEAFFRCPLAFAAGRNELVLAPADLDLPLVSGNAELAPFFEDRADGLLAEADASAPLEARVRAALAGALRGDLPPLEDVAQKLALSPRTLQRRLHAEGTSYQRLVDEVREGLARRHVREGRLGATEIAFLLGFTNPNSFYRAFRRWTGTTPEAFRARGERAATPRLGRAGAAPA
ncbi:MAG TPA: AraC family transcriptional regulator [Polyangiaceae bacterium]|nr:AraC family transcriptional regulator [Polyangiaceae bacterium]